MKYSMALCLFLATAPWLVASCSRDSDTSRSIAGGDAGADSGAGTGASSGRVGSGGDGDAKGGRGGAITQGGAASGGSGEGGSASGGKGQGGASRGGTSSTTGGRAQGGDGVGGMGDGGSAGSTSDNCDTVGCGAPPLCGEPCGSSCGCCLCAENTYDGAGHVCEKGCWAPVNPVEVGGATGSGGAAGASGAGASTVEDGGAGASTVELGGSTGTGGSGSGGANSEGGSGNGGSGGAQTICGHAICSTGESCCGPTACGTCIPNLTGPACPETCGGAGGAGAETCLTDGGNRWAFPVLERSCDAASDCILVVMTVDCCGSQAVGAYAKEQLSAFEPYAVDCAARAMCECMGVGSTTESGEALAQLTDARAHCVNGSCAAVGP